MHFFLRLLTCNELVWMDMNLSKLQEILEDRGAWCAAAPEVTKSQTQLSHWTSVEGPWEGANYKEKKTYCIVKIFNIWFDCFVIILDFLNEVSLERVVRIFLTWVKSEVRYLAHSPSPGRKGVAEREAPFVHILKIIYSATLVILDSTTITLCNTQIIYGLPVAH